MVGLGFLVSLESTMEARHIRRFFQTSKVLVAMTIVVTEAVVAVYSGIGKESWSRSGSTH